MIRKILIFLSLSLATLSATSIVGEPAFSKDCDSKPSKCLKKYVKDEYYFAASNVYNKNQELFRLEKESRRRADELQEIADFLNQRFSAAMEPLQAQMTSQHFDPTNVANWSEIGDTLSKAKTVYVGYISHKILFEEKYQSPVGLQFIADFESIRKQIETQQTKAFLAYNHGSQSSFFELYPLTGADSSAKIRVVKSAWPLLKPEIESMDREGLLLLVSSWTGGYPRRFQSLFGDDIKDVIAESYYRQVMDNVRADKPRLYEYISTSFRQGLDKSLHPPESINERLLLVILDSPGDPRIDFRVGGFETFKIIRSIPSAESLDFYDLILVIAVTDKEFIEETVSTDSVGSKFKAGTQTESNPAYVRAQSAYTVAVNNVNIASSNYQQAVAAYNENPHFGTGWTKGVATRKLSGARTALSSAESKLRSTPPYITKTVYQPYDFSTSTIRLSRKVKGVVAMITSSSKYSSVASFDKSEFDNLRIAIGIHELDAGSAAKYKSSSDLEVAKKAAIYLLVPDVLSELDSNDAERKKTENREIFLTAISKPERELAPQILADVSREQMSVARTAHPSINGVVVIRTPLGSIGTGFFVDSKHILTNYHVVGDSNFAQIELSDGRTTTGRVVAYDINRDLALVRTDVEGQPLVLFSEHTLPLGESVTAIGHPSGLTFSVTKGIISAVREQKTTSSMGFGAEYLFVQTDTAISPGSSGGPLLLNNKVIGINTEKLVDVKVEGVGFALHYAEIARFLATSMSN